MKTLHIESGMHLYGGALQVVFLLKGLAARGDEAVLVCPIGSAIAQAARPHAARVHEVDMRRGDLDAGLTFRLRSLIDQERPELVHLHSRRGSELWGGLAARWSGVPAVLSRRVDNTEPRWWMSLRYRLYDHVIAISHGIRQVLLDGGLQADQVSCVHSAVDTEQYRPGRAGLPWLRAEFGLADDELTIAMAAQFIARKGHATLLAAMPAVLAAHPRTRLLLFGQGPRHEVVREEVEVMNLADRVVFAGFRNDLHRILPCIDVMAHPAEKEGLGVSLLQAAACGVPIVAARAGGIPEIVRPGLNGELIEPHGSAELSGHLIRLLGDSALRQRYGTAGRAIVEQEFSTNAMVDGNRAVYRQVLARRAARNRSV
jgi:glycosyltransferase involved in cell wall biosynthesis